MSFPTIEVDDFQFNLDIFDPDIIPFSEVNAAEDTPTALVTSEDADRFEVWTIAFWIDSELISVGLRSHYKR